VDFSYEKRVASRLLAAIEDGALSIADAKPLYEDADPALVYLFFAWLRVRYPSSHPDSDGVLGRIVALCQASPKVARHLRAGEKDAIVGWFEETYDYRDLDRDTLVSFVVEKLEG
jgi:hypothetical protein